MSTIKKGATSGLLLLGVMLLATGCGNGSSSTAASTPDEKKKFLNGPSYNEMSPEARKIQDSFSHPQGGNPTAVAPPAKH